MNQTTILGSMLLAYIVPVAFVYYKYNIAASTRSISSIITSEEPFIYIAPLVQTRYFIGTCMLIMAIFTVFYEYQRCFAYMNSHFWSLTAIVILLVGIFGVIFIPEQNPTHYFFASAAFLAIFGFMTAHTLLSSGCTHDNLRILLYVQLLFMVVTVIGVIQDAAIFAAEALFLMNFAIFYLYLHFQHSNQ